MDRPNISTEYHPEGSDRNPSDTLDRDSKTPVAPATVPTGKADGSPVIDEKGRPLSGDGLIDDVDPPQRPSKD